MKCLWAIGSSLLHVVSSYLKSDAPYAVGIPDQILSSSVATMDIKHFTTASEIKAYQGHLPKHKPQEMITQYACNKPASWPLNIRFSAAKTRFTQSKFRMLHLLHCVVLVTFAREKKAREPLFKQTLKVTFHIITSLWVVFGLSTLFSYY